MAHEAPDATETQGLDAGLDTSTAPANESTGSHDLRHGTTPPLPMESQDEAPARSYFRQEAPAAEPEQPIIAKPELAAGDEVVANPTRRRRTPWICRRRAYRLKPAMPP